MLLHPVVQAAIEFIVIAALVTDMMQMGIYKSSATVVFWYYLTILPM